MTATIIPFPRAPAKGLIELVSESFALRKEMIRRGYSSDQIEKEISLLESLPSKERDFILAAVLPSR